MINLTNSEYHFSYYENLYSSKAPEGELDINELIEVIKYGYLKEPITQLRATSDKETYLKLKASTLPAVTLSGIFTARNSKSLQAHSGLIQIDIDNVPHYQEVMEKIMADPYTYVAFRSPGGNGIKVIVKINPDESTHLEQFYALELYYQQHYAIEIDKACKDVARCMLLSYDPDIFCNPFSYTFDECFMPEKEEVLKNERTNIYLNLFPTDQEGIIELIVSKIEENKIDITNGYENWIKIGYALSGALGENGRAYFHRVSRFHPEYNPTKCDKQFTQLYQRNNGAIGIGTLIYYAKQNHIQIEFPVIEHQAQNQHTTISSEEKKKHRDVNLFEVLKDKRRKLAQEEKLPAYMIFKDKTLQDMCDNLPETPEQFESLIGVGAIKLEKYAQHFLPIIRQYKGIETPVNLDLKPSATQQVSTTYQYSDQDTKLYENLRNLRLKISKKEGIKAYLILSNSALAEIVHYKPKDKIQLQRIKGIGQKKSEWLGEAIITEVEKILE